MQRTADFDVERRLAWLIVVGVAAVGIYDFAESSPPAGLFGLPPGLSLAVFLGGCGLVACLVSVRGLADRFTRGRMRTVLAVASLIPATFSDPTYASLVVIVALIDIRRRDAEPTRTIWSVGLLTVVAAVVLTEGTRRTTPEIEAMFGLAIALSVVVLLGDALRGLDERVATEAELAQMTERSRMAEDIHDSLGHHLLASSVQLQKAKALQELDPGRSAEAVDHAAQAVAEAISETRLIVDATRAGGEIAVEASLRELAHRILPAETEMRLQVSGDLDALDPPRQVAVYRIVQEALTNLVKHSGATAATVSSRVGPETVTVEVRDDGTGFSVESVDGPGGLANMRRRVEELGGAFEIESGEGGTLVMATVPR